MIARGWRWFRARPWWLQAVAWVMLALVTINVLSGGDGEAAGDTRPAKASSSVSPPTDAAPPAAKDRGSENRSDQNSDEPAKPREQPKKKTAPKRPKKPTTKRPTRSDAPRRE